MNRRSFLKSLGLLAVVPFVPVTAFKHLMPNPDVPFKCYRSNAETLEQLILQLREARKQGLLHSRFATKKDKVYGVVSLDAKNWDHIFSQINPSARFMDVVLAQKGYSNFIWAGIPIIERG